MGTPHQGPHTCSGPGAVVGAGRTHTVHMYMLMRVISKSAELSRFQREVRDAPSRVDTLKGGGGGCTQILNGYPLPNGHTKQKHCTSILAVSRSSAKLQTENLIRAVTFKTCKCLFSLYFL